MKKLFLLILLFPLSAFSKDLSGTTWALSGVGCTDRNLDYSSFRSKSRSSANTSWGKFEFIDDGNVLSTHILKRQKHIQEGLYNISGDKVDLEGPNREEWLELYMRRDNKGKNILVLIGDSISESYENCCPHKIILWRDWRELKKNLAEEGEETWEEYKRRQGHPENEWPAENIEEYEQLREKCAKEHPFVYVLRPV